MEVKTIVGQIKEEFPVDFEKFWQWAGFARKGNAKNMLEREFKQDVDSCIFVDPRNKKNPKGGRPPCQIQLSIERAKAFGMRPSKGL